MAAASGRQTPDIYRRSLSPPSGRPRPVPLRTPQSTPPPHNDAPPSFERSMDGQEETSWLSRLGVLNDKRDPPPPNPPAPRQPAAGQQLPADGPSSSPSRGRGRGAAPTTASLVSTARGGASMPSFGRGAVGERAHLLSDDLNGIKGDIHLVANTVQSGFTAVTGAIQGATSALSADTERRDESLSQLFDSVQALAEEQRATNGLLRTLVDSINAPLLQAVDDAVRHIRRISQSPADEQGLEDYQDVDMDVGLDSEPQSPLSSANPLSAYAPDAPLRDATPTPSGDAPSNQPSSLSLAERLSLPRNPALSTVFLSWNSIFSKDDYEHNLRVVADLVAGKLPSSSSMPTPAGVFHKRRGGMDYLRLTFFGRAGPSAASETEAYHFTFKWNELLAQSATAYVAEPPGPSSSASQ
ncbi:RNase H domain-containing protein [Mycena kentingensis (nom. inval.)]|nr:RNase H domain-containing protein [Mycena kentingensis (nom. inval.)]